ncbi:hypothetical protein LHJ74_20615 [Streptomyces sp. N2-109]|uniref:NfeD-like C-terminal domain-containing protein n=1 Tax=Streptomyces gossypii TaxID=2883101 RepID=A0ABT2JWQ7_9ACTN|nr:hypothetical protein [Streptomyces gossypii]MCT2592276.1 hypothetical protein [Streptomyces gossypii]
MALAVYLASVGLDAANQWAGVLGLFVALAGLAVSLAGMRRGASGPDPGQGVRDSFVRGGVALVGKARNVRISQHGSAAGGSGSGPSVSGSRVSGPVAEVTEAAGDVEIEQGP